MPRRYNVQPHDVGPDAFPQQLAEERLSDAEALAVMSEADVLAMRHRDVAEAFGAMEAGHALRFGLPG